MTYDPNQPRDDIGRWTDGQLSNFENAARKAAGLSSYNLNNVSELVQYLDQIPPSQRKRSDFPFENLIAYHITKDENMESIRENGILAKSSSQSYDRPNAVYFFLNKNELTQENIDILGFSKGYKILRVKIPVEKVMENMVWDGLYNVSFQTQSAVQYYEGIPKEWIISYDYKK